MLFRTRGARWYVRYLVQSGRWPDEKALQNVDRETYEWLFLAAKQEMLGIRHQR